VGVELAGEIATAYPLKHVTLVSGAPAALMPGYPTGLAQSLEAQLRNMGVNPHLGTRVETLGATDSPYIGGLSCMPEAPADQLVFPALGARPVTTLFREMLGARFDAQGRVKVDAWLRPAGHCPDQGARTVHSPLPQGIRIFGAFRMRVPAGPAFI
jgi:NADH dehydrogenase FAD-containing subunit